MTDDEISMAAREVLRRGPTGNVVRERIEAWAESAAIKYGEDDRQVQLAVAALEFPNPTLWRIVESALTWDEVRRTESSL